MANVEERLVDLIKISSIDLTEPVKRVVHFHKIKQSTNNHRILENFFHDILAPIARISFHPDGSRAIYGEASSLQVWDIDKLKGPELIWTCQAARTIDYLRYAPDGTLFCTGSRSDKRVKVWSEVGTGQFSFVYLNHPAPVTGLEWRRTSNSYDVVKTFISVIANILVTSCQDNKVRIWIQTLPLYRGETTTHFHLAAVLDAENAHWVNNKECFLQDLLARTLKNDDAESLVDQFDQILDSTLKEWRSVPDLLFSIDKSDGTLTAWHLKYLDGEENGVYRQIITNESSCIKMTLPLHDATTLSSNVTTYSHSGEQTNIFMLTQHISGTLGLWKLNLESGVDLVARITGLPISPMWLRDGSLTVHYHEEDSTLTTHWSPEGSEPTDPERNTNVYKASGLSNNIKILPQYHLKQLVELLAFGRMQRVKAILNHLVNCLDIPDQGQRKSHRSRTFSIVTQPSVNESFELGNPLEQPVIQEIELDYIEVTSVKPLSLYLLLESDTEKPNDGKLHHAHEEFSTTYDYIPYSKSQVDETLDEILGKSTIDAMNKQKVANLEQSKGSLSNFNPKKARTLTKILTHTHLPGLTKVDQMHLLAVADALAFFDASPEDLNEVQEDGAGGISLISTNMAIDSLDDRGLRFLTAMRQYVYLTKYLPMNQRAELREQGIGNHNLVWAFHSETQEELIGLIPCVQRNKPNWVELREFGIGWWVKKLEVLRKLIEKVAQSAYQAKQDPLDAALFYLAMKKKTLVCALLRRVNCDKRLLKLFEQDFNDPVNKKKALKNAYALLGLHRFEHAAAFFLLAGSIWDAVEVCINNLNDIQLAMVLIRLYDSDPGNLRRLLVTEILGGSANAPYSYKSEKAHNDPFLRSIAFWRLGDYLSAVHTLLEEEVGGDSSVSASVFNFYRFLKDQPLVSKHKHQLLEELEVKQRTSPIEEEHLHFHRARSLSSGQLGLEGVKRTKGTVKQSSTEYEVLNETTHLVDKYSDEAVADKERRLFFHTAQTYLDSGCPLLALEVLCREDQLDKSQAQRMKFIACLHILLNELNTLGQDTTMMQTGELATDDHHSDQQSQADGSGSAQGGPGEQQFSDQFSEWLECNIGALREMCSYSGGPEPILHTMLTYCSLHIATYESLNAVRSELLRELSL